MPAITYPKASVSITISFVGLKCARSSTDKKTTLSSLNACCASSNRMKSRFISLVGFPFSIPLSVATNSYAILLKPAINLL